MLRDRQIFLLSDEVCERRAFNETATGIFNGPFGRVLPTVKVSRCSPAPRISHDGEEFEVTADLVRDVDVSVVIRIAERNVALKKEHVSDGLSSVLWNMYEVKARAARIATVLSDGITKEGPDPHAP
jgi:hypothetical protein